MDRTAGHRRETGGINMLESSPTFASSNSISLPSVFRLLAQEAQGATAKTTPGAGERLPKQRSRIAKTAVASAETSRRHSQFSGRIKLVP